MLGKIPVNPNSATYFPAKEEAESKADEENQQNQDINFDDYSVIKDLEALLVDAERLIPADKRPDPDSIDDKQTEKIVQDILRLTGLTATSYKDEADIEEDFIQKQAKNLEQASDLLMKINAVSPNTLLDIYKKCIQVTTILNKEATLITRALRHTPDDFKKRYPGANAEYMRTNMYKTAFMFGFRFAIPRAKNEVAYMKAIRRQALDALHNLIPVQPGEYTPTEDDELRVILPSPKKKKAAPSSERRNNKKPRPTKPKPVSPEEKRQNQKTKLAQMKETLTSNAMKRRMEIALARENQSSLLSKIDETSTSIPVAHAVYVSKLERLESLHAQYDEIVARLKEKGHDIADTIDPEQRLSKDDLNGQKNAKPDISTIKKPETQPSFADISSYDQDDPEIKAACGEIMELRAQAHQLKDTLAHLKNQNAVLDRATKKQTSQLSRILKRTERAEKRIILYRTGIAALSKLDEKTDHVVAETGYPPLSMLGEWAAANLKGRVEIHPDAMETLAKVAETHRNPEKIYQGLELLVNEFYGQKMSSGLKDDERQAARKAFMDKADKLHFGYGGSVTNITNRVVRNQGAVPDN